MLRNDPERSSPTDDLERRLSALRFDGPRPELRSRVFDRLDAELEARTPASARRPKWWIEAALAAAILVLAVSIPRGPGSAGLGSPVARPENAQRVDLASAADLEGEIGRLVGGSARPPSHPFRHHVHHLQGRRLHGYERY